MVEFSFVPEGGEEVGFYALSVFYTFYLELFSMLRYTTEYPAT